MRGEVDIQIWIKFEKVEGNLAMIIFRMKSSYCE